MMTLNVNDPRFDGASDADCIQKAVDAAGSGSVRTVYIPRYNRRRNADVWEIGRAVLLPDGVTILLDDCRLRLADQTVDNIFRNRNAYSKPSKAADTAQRGIRILGNGDAVLDGGKDSGVREQHWSGGPHPRTGNLILLVNVEDYEIRRIQCVNMRYWAINQIACRNGHLSDIRFSISEHHPNQDGINLRMGCEHITVENISGRTGDDIVALTALACCDDRDLLPPDLRPDIHDVVIRNVRGNTFTTVVALRATDGSKLYDITIENITGLPDPASSGPVGVVRLGDCNWYKDHPTRLGDMHDITVRNVRSYNFGCVFLEGALENCRISEIYGEGATRFAVSTYQNEGICDETGCMVTGGVSLRNVVIEKVFYSGDPDDPAYLSPNIRLAPYKGKPFPGAALYFLCMQESNTFENAVFRDIFAREGSELLMREKGPEPDIRR